MYHTRCTSRKTRKKMLNRSSMKNDIKSWFLCMKTCLFVRLYALIIFPVCFCVLSVVLVFPAKNVSEIHQQNHKKSDHSLSPSTDAIRSQALCGEHRFTVCFM